MEKFKELEKLVESIKDDVRKFYEKGNNSAGVRVRKALQDIKLVAHEMRKLISEEKNLNQ
jgi:hypothetical protein